MPSEGALSGPGNKPNSRRNSRQSSVDAKPRCDRALSTEMVGGMLKVRVAKNGLPGAHVQQSQGAFACYEAADQAASMVGSCLGQLEKHGVVGFAQS